MLCLSVAIAAVPSSQISVPAGGTTVPMLSVGGRPGVEVTIDGAGPYPGASRTVIDPAWVSGRTGAVTLTNVRLGTRRVAVTRPTTTS